MGNVESEDMKYEYDDLTTPEIAGNMFMLALYLILFIINVLQFNRNMKDNRSLIWNNRFIALYILVALACRMVYFSDSFYILDGNNRHNEHPKHLIPILVYVNVSSICFFCVSQFCILICRMWLRMADVIMDQPMNKTVSTILGITIYINPLFLILQIVLEIFEKMAFVAIVVTVNSIVVAILVSVSGWIFRKSLNDYFSGKFILRVQLNVFVICLCYFMRGVYDLSKYFVHTWFTNMRKTQAQDNRSWWYIIFLTFLLVITEYVPILMFTLNLKYVFNHQTPLLPKARGFSTSKDGISNLFQYEKRETAKQSRQSLMEDYYET